VSLIKPKDQSLSNPTSYATSKFEREILPQDIMKGQKNRKNSMKNSSKWRNPTNKISHAIQNTRKTLLKVHLEIVLKEL
jgi:hypothetical protein